VNWTDCDAFTLNQGLSLPSEEEWEYAARAGTSTVWWTGDEPSRLRGAANLADISLSEVWSMPHEEWDDGALYTEIVGSYAANPFGLHDVHGNVDEWCRDRWLPYSATRQPADENPSSDEVPTTRMSRGGGFLGPGWRATSARRVDGTPDTRWNYIGLRPARAIVKD
jgi:formylglycine-generating enzyme